MDEFPFKRRSHLEQAIDDYDERHIQNWEQLVETATKHINLLWAADYARAKQRPGWPFVDLPNDVQQFFAIGEDFQNIHWSIFMGARLAINDGYPWKSPQKSVLAAHHFGELIIYLNNYMGSAELITRSEREPLSPDLAKELDEEGMEFIKEWDKEVKNDAELETMEVYEALTNKIDSMRELQIPLPTSTAVIKTLQTFFPTWPDILYKNISSILGENRPDFNPSSPKPRNAEPT